VTVVGPGGIGKTTVGLDVAERMIGTYEHGVWQIDLAPLSDPCLVPSAVATTLGVEVRAEDPLPGLVAALRDSRALLLLDNCEHVIDAAAGLAWREAIAERVAAAEPHKWYPQRAGRADLVTERARAEGRAADPLVRQEIARLTELAWSARWTAARAAAARAAGQAPGPEGSLGKLASSRIARQAARVHALIAGPSAMLIGAGSPLDGVIAEITLSVPAISIAGGTDEIQRTIIAERILGLPREPDTARDLPFRDLPHNG